MYGLITALPSSILGTPYQKLRNEEALCMRPRLPWPGWLRIFTVRLSCFSTFIYLQGETLTSLNNMVGDCYAFRISVFFEIAFTTNGPTHRSVLSRMLLINISSDALTKINSHVFSPQGLLSGNLTNICPKITPSQWKDTGSLFVWKSALLTRKCHVFLEQTVTQYWMSGLKGIYINMLEVFCSDSRWCVTPLGLCCNMALLYLLLSTVYYMNGITPFQGNDKVHVGCFM